MGDLQVGESPSRSSTDSVINANLSSDLDADSANNFEDAFNRKTYRHSTSSATSRLSKRTRLSGLKENIREKTKARTKKFFRVEKTGDLMDFEDGPDSKSANIHSSPAFNPGKTFEKSKENGADVGMGRKLKGAVVGIVDTVKDPKNSITKTVTGTIATKLSKSQQPFLPKTANMEFIEAHEAMEQAQVANYDCQASREEALDEHKRNIKAMEKTRESVHVAWITDRHLEKVKVVRKEQRRFPNHPADFRDFGDDGPESKGKLRYEKWLGQVIFLFSLSLGT
jgi:hypothetical protein